MPPDGGAQVWPTPAGPGGTQVCGEHTRVKPQEDCGDADEEAGEDEVMMMVVSKDVLMVVMIVMSVLVRLG